MARKDRQISSSKDMKCFYCCLWQLKEKRSNHQVTQMWYFPPRSLPCKVFLFHKVHRVGLRIRQLHRIKGPLHIFLKFVEGILVIGPVSMESSLGWGSSVHLDSRYLGSVLKTRYKPRCKFQLKLFGKCLLFILAV